MQLQKLAIFLTLSFLCFGCKIRISKVRAQQTSAVNPAPFLNTPLKAALEEVNTLKVKIERDGGIHPKEYSEDIADLENIVDQAYGDPKTLKAVKSVLEGHQLSLQFVQCDRISGYDELHQCQDKVLKKVFVKYPEFAAAVEAAVEGENLPYISAGLDRDAVLQAIWHEIGQDTDAVVVAVNPASNPNASLPQQ